MSQVPPSETKGIEPSQEPTGVKKAEVSKEEQIAAGVLLKVPTEFTKPPVLAEHDIVLMAQTSLPKGISDVSLRDAIVKLCDEYGGSLELFGSEGSQLIGEDAWFVSEVGDALNKAFVANDLPQICSVPERLIINDVIVMRTEGGCTLVGVDNLEEFLENVGEELRSQFLEYQEKGQLTSLSLEDAKEVTHEAYGQAGELLEHVNEKIEEGELVEETEEPEETTEETTEETEEPEEIEVKDELETRETFHSISEKGGENVLHAILLRSIFQRFLRKQYKQTVRAEERSREKRKAYKEQDKIAEKRWLELKEAILRHEQKREIRKGQREGYTERRSARDETEGLHQARKSEKKYTQNIEEGPAPAPDIERSIGG